MSRPTVTLETLNRMIADDRARELEAEARVSGDGHPRIRALERDLERANARLDSIRADL